MKIYIEIIAVLLFLFFLLSWKIWEKLSRKKLLKNYSIDNDKSRKGEEKQRAKRELDKRTTSGNKQRTGTESPGTRNKSANPIRPSKPKGRSILPKTNTSSSRKNRFGFRGFFKRRK